MNKKIIVATGQYEIDDAITKFNGYEMVASLVQRKEILVTCKNTIADLIILGEGLHGDESLVEIIIQLSKAHPNLRIIYLCGKVDSKDTLRINNLGLLVMSGIYDIIIEGNLSVKLLKSILDTPKTLDSVSFLTKSIKEDIKKDKAKTITFEVPQDIEDEHSDYNNLFVMSSIKPGTGKSFLATNVAAAIAKFGVNTKDNKKPKVAIIEADLQNLSVGTLLQIEDDKRNIKTAMDKISTIVKNGELISSNEKIREVNAYIKNCFIPYRNCSNLEALVGSQLTMNDLKDIESSHYIYLIDAIIGEYDVIIIDTNSSLNHITTFPLLKMAKTCYYILNLDFNNIRNNVRYKEFLRELDILDKVKYVLNEDIDKSNPANKLNLGLQYEDLMFTAEHLNDSDFNLEARIPTIPKSIFLNRLYQGTPVVLDNNSYTLDVRCELLKVANQIWPIKNFDEIDQKILNSKKKIRKGKLL